MKPHLHPAISAGFKRTILSTLAGLALMTGLLSGASFRTIAFFPIKGVENIGYLTNQNLVPVELPRRDFSPEYPIEPGASILFAKPGTEGAPPVTLLKVTIPQSMSKVLLVFLPASKPSGKPFNVLVLDDSLVALKAGELRLINISHSTVLGYLGEHKLLIKPHEVRTVKAPRRLKDGQYYVNLASIKDGKNRPLCRTYWPEDPEIRQLIFIFDDLRRKSVRLMGIDDPVVPE